MEHGESRQHLVIAVTDSLSRRSGHFCCAARGRRAITGKMAEQTPPYESVSSTALRRLRTQRCATGRHSRSSYYSRFSFSVSLPASSVVFSFIASINFHTLNSASSVHKTNTNRAGGNVGCAWGSRRGCVSVWRVQDVRTLRSDGTVSTHNYSCELFSDI